MKYSKLFNLLKKAIEYKRKKMNEEEKEIEKKKQSSPSLQDKRKKLKQLYTKTLKGTPYENNIPVFMDLIDQVPEDYIDYELGINMNNALKTVDELISGEGELTKDELASLANIVSGVGIPAIEKHATGKKKLSKETGKFGSEAINKNTEEFLSSLKKRRSKTGKLEAPKSKELTKQDKSVARRDFLDKIKKDLQINIPKDSPLFKTASRLKSKGINVERLARSMQGAKKYSEAKKQAQKELEKQGKSLEDLRATDDLYNLFMGVKKKKEEKVRRK